MHSLLWKNTEMTNPNNETQKPQISASNISKFFIKPDGSKFYALSNVSFSVNKGEVCIISGANGSGKSLLMQIIAGLVKQSSGTVDNVSKPGIVFQDAEAAILGDTPLDDVLFGLSNIGIRKKQGLDIALKSLESVGLSEKKDSPSRMLSGGEKRRLAIASIIAMGFETIILDEPYSNMDYNGVKSVNRIIRSLHNEGKTIVILSHEIEKCLGMADRFVVLYNGKIEYNAETDNISELPLEKWGIKNPLNACLSVNSLVWE